MNQIPAYQHPFFDVFQSLKIAEWKKAHKEGDVKVAYDKSIAKTTVTIGGATSASNYIQVPPTKNLPKEALGLIGKYLYILLNVPANKNCVMHFDYIVNDSRTVRLSVSNIYKEIQIPLANTLQNGRWTVIMIDALHFLTEGKCFAAGQNPQFSLRSFQIQSNCAIRGVYTSDIQYTAMTLPKAMQFKAAQDNCWFGKYAWLQFPPSQEDTQAQMMSAEQAAAASSTGGRSNLKKRAGSQAGKKVTFNSNKKDEEEEKSAPQSDLKAKKRSKMAKNSDARKSGDSAASTKDSEEILKEASSPEKQFQAELEEHKARQKALKEALDKEILEKQREGVELTTVEIEKIRKEYESSLESKNITEQAEMRLYQDKALYDPNKSQRRNCENFVLKPDPIMAIDKVVGMHPRFSAKQVHFNRDAKLASEILYCQANLLLGYHAKLQKQRLFADQNQGPIDSFAATKNHAVTVCRLQTNSQQDCFLMKNGSLVSKNSLLGAKKDQELQVTVWDLDDNQKPVFQFRPPLSKLQCITISADQNSLCFLGKDFQGRELILIYAFQEMITYQKVELVARQLSDIELIDLSFNEASPTSLIGCGKENIRFYKMKNNYLPGQLVSLNNTARGKMFTGSSCAYKIVEDQKTKHKSKKPTQVFVTTECGLLYIINFFTRQVDKIIEIHDGPVQAIRGAPAQADESIPFFLTASKAGNLRIWSPDFEKLVSEVAINQEISGCDISVDQKQISVLATDGTLSLLELESSSFNVLQRSHNDEIISVAHNALSGHLVSIGRDSSIKIWVAETMQQIHEFNTSPHDPPTSLASSSHDSLIAVGFKSGFLRLFNLEERKMEQETMMFESSVMDIKFSPKGKFLACFFKNAKIVIFNLEMEDKMQPVKNIDYEFPNANYFSLGFSPDDSLLANISSNANTITIWETKNFSLRWMIDLTGEIISKIAFSPNMHDLLVMTTNSKLKVLRIDHEKPHGSELETVRDQFGICDQECTDFAVSPNGKFVFVSGKENLIRVYDYFMRGSLVAAQQAFSGHLQYATELVITNDMRHLYSIGPGNGIFKWAFFGDKEMPHDLSTQFEKTQTEIAREEKKEEEIEIPTFNQKELQTYTERQIAELKGQMIDSLDGNPNKATGESQINRPHKDLIADGGLSLKRTPKIEYTPAGYTFEQHEIQIKKILGCSMAPKVRDNLIWDQERHCLIYSMENILVCEELNPSKEQALKNECNDYLYEIKMSPNKKLMLAYTKVGTLDGFPQIIVWNTTTRRKVQQIAIDDTQIVSVQFSNASNLLLVVSNNGNKEQPKSTVAIWDFLDGRREYLAKSILPFEVRAALWNPYIKTQSDEFVTISPRKYHYWRVTQDLQMQYQQGDLPKAFGSASNCPNLTTMQFVEPMVDQNSVYLLIGLDNGSIWVLDTRSNYFLYSANIIDKPIAKITSSMARIVVEGVEDTDLHCWELNKTINDLDYDASDPNYFFQGKEKRLKLDGYPSASAFDETAAQAIVISSNGSFWLLNFIESLTIKLKSCHSPEHALQAVDYKYVSPNQFQHTLAQEASSDRENQLYEFDQNYLVGSSGKDGVVKVWNLYDMEHCLNFTVPKEECLSIAMHQFKPYMVCAFTDGYLRFFDLQDSKNLGRCRIFNPNEEADPNQEKSGSQNNSPDLTDHVVKLQILPSGNHLFAATRNGQIVLVHVDSWNPLTISLETVASLSTALNSFDVSFLEPYNKWLASTCNGKIVVYNRQDSSSFKQELFEKNKKTNFIFMDSFNCQEYVDNCFTEARRVNTLDHFYSLSKRNLVYNEVSPENETQAAFLNNDLASVICYVRKSPNLFIRNFELHQVVKKIQLESPVIQMQLSPGSLPYVYLISEDNHLRMVDFVNETNQSEIGTIHQKVTSVRVCPNGRYVMTGGNKGDCVVYSIRRQNAANTVNLAQMAVNDTNQIYQEQNSLSRANY